MKYTRPNNSYPNSWNRLRHFRFRKDGYICALCGEYAKDNLHLHHIIPINCGGTHRYDNLAVLCSRCHAFVHNGKYNGPLLKLRRM